MRNDELKRSHMMFIAKHVVLAAIVLMPFMVAEMLARIVLSAPTFLDVASKIPAHLRIKPLVPGDQLTGHATGGNRFVGLAWAFVIAVIGDSHTYSSRSARREDSFPARLEHHLMALTGKNVKVLNFGVPGYNMAQELEVLRSRALPFKPDLVILQYCINDEHISDYIQPKYSWLNRMIHQSVFFTHVWTRVHILEVRKITCFILRGEVCADCFSIPRAWSGRLARKRRIPHAPHPPRGRDQVPARYHDVIGRENLERDVRAFGELCKQRGTPAVATGFIEERDRHLYEASGFEVYSFFEIFHEFDMRDFGYDPESTDGHFQENGSDRIGKSLAEFIRAKGFSYKLH